MLRSFLFFDRINWPLSIFSFSSYPFVNLLTLGCHFFVLLTETGKSKALHTIHVIFLWFFFFLSCVLYLSFAFLFSFYCGSQWLRDGLTNEWQRWSINTFRIYNDVRKNVYDFSTFMRFQALTTIKMGLIMEIRRPTDEKKNNHTLLKFRWRKKPALPAFVNV